MWKRLLLIIGMALLIVIIGYQISFIRTRERIHKEDSLQEQGQNPEPESSVTVGTGTDKVTKDTRIIMESYDAAGDLIRREETMAGAEFVGNNRLDMLVYAGTYREQAPEQEEKDGLERMVLESYSPDCVTFVKYYGEPKEEEGFLIGVKDNAVIVYLADRSEVYEYTNIELWSLPAEIQYDLVEGIYVKNEQELFDFLQTYSS